MISTSTSGRRIRGSCSALVAPLPAYEGFTRLFGATQRTVSTSSGAIREIGLPSRMTCISTSSRPTVGWHSAPAAPLLPRRWGQPQFGVTLRMGSTSSVMSMMSISTSGRPTAGWRLALVALLPLPGCFTRLFGVTLRTVSMSSGASQSRFFSVFPTMVFISTRGRKPQPHQPPQVLGHRLPL